MKLRKLKYLSWHIVMLPIFFIWHNINEYFGLLPYRVAAFFLLCYITFSLLIFSFSKLLLKKNISSGIFTTIFLVIFFFWGSFHDWIRSLNIHQFFASYKFLLTLVLLTLIALLIILKRKKKFQEKINTFINITLLVFLFFELSVSIYKFTSGQIEKNNINYKEKHIDITLSQITQQQKPDIFLIIFDEYASSSALSKFFSFDNTNLDSRLNENNFFIVKNSKSNYNFTPWSLISILNLKYPHTDDAQLTTKKILQSQYSVEKSLLPQLLETQGYHIKNLGLFAIGNSDSDFKEQLFDDNFNNIFYNETMWARIESEILWNTGLKTSRLIPEKNIYTPQKTLQNLASTLHELKIQNDTPKFVYAHFLLPHDPYHFDSSGIIRNISEDYTSKKRDSLYLDQLKYANVWIDSFATASNKSFNRPRVVIIEGDHGRRDSVLKSIPVEKSFMNLSSFYFSDKDYSLLHDSISPVNSFRVILNKYFNTNLPLLKDLTIVP